MAGVRFSAGGFADFHLFSGVTSVVSKTVSNILSLCPTCLRGDGKQE